MYQPFNRLLNELFTDRIQGGRQAPLRSLCGPLSGRPAVRLFPKACKSAILSAMSEEKRTVNEDTLEKLLYLSRLSPESTDMDTLKKQVDDIVGYFDILSKYDDSENPYDAYPTTTAAALREDEVVPGLEMHDVKKVSEHFLDGYFQVPKVLGEGA